MTDGNKKTILLVEDEVLIAMSEKMTLEKFGYNIIIAHSGEKTVEIMAQSTEIDLVLMDIDLGRGIDGTEAARRILLNRTVPIVFNTSHSEREMVERVRGITRYGYVIKNSGDFVLQSSLEMAFELFDANKKIVERDEKYRLLADNISDVLWIVDLKTEQFVYVSPSVERMRGYSVDEVMRQTTIQTMTQSSFAFVQEDLHRRFKLFMEDGVQDIEERNEIEQTRKDGTTVWTETTTRFARNEHGEPILIGITHDISKRKQAEDSLRKSESRHSKMVSNIGDVIVIIDKDGINRYKSSNIEKYFGWKPEEVLGVSALENIHPDDLNSAQKFMAKLMAEPGATKTSESRYRCKDGTYKWIEFTAVNLLHDPDICGILGNYHDITERKSAEIILYESNERVNLILENAPIAIWDWNIKSDKWYATQKFYTMLGYEPVYEYSDRTVWLDRVHPDDRESVGLKIDNVLNHRDDSYCYNARMLHADGSYRWHSVIGQVIERDEDGNAVRMLGVRMDINADKKAEAEIKEKNEKLAVMNEDLNETMEEMDAINEKLISSSEDLQQSRERLREASEMAHLGHWEWNVKTGAVEWSEEIYKIFCQDPKGFIPHIDSILAFSPWPEDNQRDKELISKAIENHESCSYEQKFLRPDKSIGYYFSTSKGKYDKDGNLVSIVGTIQDITERKKTEDALRESERDYKNLFASHAAVKLIIDPETGNIIDANTAAANFYGWSCDDLKKMKIQQINISSPEEIRSSMQKSKVREQTHFEFKHKKANGSIRDVDVFSNNIRMGGKEYLHSIIYDVTESKQTVEALRKSEHKFSSLFTHMLEGFALHEIICDKSGRPTDYRFLDMNPAFERLTGLRKEDVIGKTILTVMPETEPVWIEKYGKVALTGEPVSFENYSSALKKHYQVMAFSPQKNQFAVIFNDITEHKQAEEVLRESEEKFRHLVGNMQVGVLLQGPQSEILMSNTKALELLGISEDQLLGKTSFDPDWNVIHEDGSPFPGPTHPVPQAIATLQPVRNVVMGVHRPVTDDRVWLLVDAEPQLNSDGTLLHVVCTFIEITKRKNAEEKIKNLLAEKELILKEVHHRIKNNMTTINSLLRLQAGKTKEPSAITALRDAGSRVLSMMVLYDKLYQSSDFEKISLQDYLPVLVDEIIANFPNSTSIKIQKKIDDFILDAQRLQSLGIIVNELLTNIMKYAFKDRKTGLITVSAHCKKNHVSIAIQDNGNGMPESIDFGNSNGFGLELVNILTRQLKGSIRIEREKGTKIILEFDI